MDILKVPGKVRMKRIFFARQFLYGNIESVWDSAVATNTLSDLLLMANLAKMSLFTHLVAFWRNVVIYALCRILVKCRDLRIFPGKKIRIPGTKNYYAGLPEGFVTVLVEERLRAILGLDLTPERLL